MTYFERSYRLVEEGDPVTRLKRKTRKFYHEVQRYFKFYVLVTLVCIIAVISVNEYLYRSQFSNINIERDGPLRSWSVNDHVLITPSDLAEQHELD